MITKTTTIAMTKAHPYGGRRRAVGEVLTIPWRDAIILKALKVAADAPRATPPPTAWAEPIADEPKKRPHKKRDATEDA